MILLKYLRTIYPRRMDMNVKSNVTNVNWPALMGTPHNQYINGDAANVVKNPMKVFMMASINDPFLLCIDR